MVFPNLIEFKLSVKLTCYWILVWTESNLIPLDRRVVHNNARFRFQFKPVTISRRQILVGTLFIFAASKLTGKGLLEGSRRLSATEIRPSLTTFCSTKQYDPNSLSEKRRFREYSSTRSNSFSSIDLATGQSKIWNKTHFNLCRLHFF